MRINLGLSLADIDTMHEMRVKRLGHGYLIGPADGSQMVHLSDTGLEFTGPKSTPTSDHRCTECGGVDNHDMDCRRSWWTRGGYDHPLFISLKSGDEVIVKVRGDRELQVDMLPRADSYSVTEKGMDPNTVVGEAEMPGCWVVIKRSTR